MTNKTANNDSRVLKEMLEMAAALDSHGLITKQDFSQIKALCNEPPPVYTPAKVTTIRTRKAKMSQSVFASILNVSLSTVQKWESAGSGKHPSGAAAKLLQVIETKGIEALI